MHLTERSSFAMSEMLALATQMFAETLDYPIADVKVVPTSKPFLLSLTFKCAPMWETGNAYQIRQKFVEFSLEMFKHFGYLIEVHEPEAFNA